jgi:hypothetical protein
VNASVLLLVVDLVTFAGGAAGVERLPAADVASGPTAGTAHGAIARSVARHASRLPTKAALRSAEMRFAQQAGRGSWIQRHPALFGAIVGFAAGCTLGASQVGGSRDHFFNALDEFACPAIGGMGAGAGAVVGWLLSRS